MSDEDLVRIIRTGIPNTPMPPSSMTEEQAGNAIARRARPRSAARSTPARWAPPSTASRDVAIAAGALEHRVATAV